MRVIVEMRDLIEWLFAAEEGGSQLDEAIADLVCARVAPVKLAGDPSSCEIPTWQYPDGSVGTCLRFTLSIDAAITLVPVGYEWECTFSRYVSHQAHVSSSRGAHGGWIGEHDHSRAIAICIAALKAWAARTGQVAA